MKKNIIACSLVLMFVFIAFPKLAYPLTEKGYKQLHTFAEILHQVEDTYVEKPDDSKLVLGAIRGMLMTLDPHTIYMPPEVYKELKVESSGKFGGLGLEVTVKKGWLTVVSAIEGTPAAKAGIKSGDRIVKVDGTSTKGADLGEAVTMMRGVVGSRVTLTITRDGLQSPRNVNLIRRVINVPSVTMEELGDGYAYAKISVFQEKTASEMIDKLAKIEAKGPLKGLVIDLRNNPGGLLGESIDLVDIFIKEGVIVSTRTREKEIARYEAKAENTEPDYPVVLLVNGGSASASEIFAGALRDYERAVLVGTQTFGKGSVQSVFELDDGSALKITVAKYYTPSGKSIQGFGITPNVTVEEGEEAEGVDRQKTAAITYVKDPAKYKKALQEARKHHN